MNKSKAQLNWEVGKEAQADFQLKVKDMLDREIIEGLVDLFIQIRQNEYRRGKEDTLKEVDEKIKELKDEIKLGAYDYSENELGGENRTLILIDKVFGKELCDGK
jgi:hypothetical protein